MRLFEELISEYSDIPYITRQRRELAEPFEGTESALERRSPDRSRSWRDEKCARHKRKRLVSQQERLDELLNLAVGQAGSEIEGVDLSGKPLKLSDYKGKVVMLVFWGTWCGPCMAEVPHERELVERYKYKPFAMLGVDCEPDKETARAVIEAQKMTWPKLV